MMSSKIEVAVVGIIIASAGIFFVAFSPPIARGYNALYAKMPGHLRFSTWWPRLFGSMLITFGLLFVVLAITVVR